MSTRRAFAAVAVLLLAAALAVASTWTVFSQVMDEPAHVGAGMEWLAAGTYTIEAQHPPLARIAVAVGPWLRGVPFVRSSLIGTGNRVFYHEGAYRANLAAARAGILPFFLLGGLSVAWLGWRRGGPPVAVLTTLSWVTLPPILAHAGFATTDLPLAATIAASLACFDAWLERRTPLRTILLGLAAGAALATKLSALGFLPAALAPLAVAASIRTRRDTAPPPAGLRRDHAILLAAAVAFLLVWASLRFSVGPLVSEESVRRATDASRAAATLRWMRAHLRVPAPEFFWGVQELGEHAEVGHLAYLRGKSSMHGWVSYFPIAIAVKTPIAFLLLALGGIGVALAAARRDPFPAAITASALGILAVAMSSSINIGIRHVLPIYAPLAVLAALGAVEAWRRPALRGWGRVGVALLLAWQLTSAVRAWPDWIAWFNEIADDAPQEWLLDSNLDWGQDLLRLEEEVKRRGIDRLALSYFGTALPRLHDFPPLRVAHPLEPTPGWIAVSWMNRKGIGLRVDRPLYGWLDPYEPVATVGKSILLYYVPAPSPAADEGS